MKIALLAMLGLVLGVLGGAALGVGIGLAWVAILKTPDFEGATPLGAVVGGFGGALMFGVATREIGLAAPACAVLPDLKDSAIDFHRNVITSRSERTIISNRADAANGARHAPVVFLQASFGS